MSSISREQHGNMPPPRILPNMRDKSTEWTLNPDGDWEEREQYEAARQARTRNRRFHSKARNGDERRRAEAPLC